MCYGVGAMYPKRHGVMRELVIFYTWTNFQLFKGIKRISAEDAQEECLTSAKPLMDSGF
jgi:hypothetical protein